MQPNESKASRGDISLDQQGGLPVPSWVPKRGQVESRSRNSQGVQARFWKVGVVRKLSLPRVPSKDQAHPHHSWSP